MKKLGLTLLVAGTFMLFSGTLNNRGTKIPSLNPTPVVQPIRSIADPNDNFHPGCMGPNLWNWAVPKGPKPVSLRGEVYTGREYFRIKNFGTGREGIVFGGDYEKYLEENAEDFSRGYHIELFRDDKSVKTIEDLPNYFNIKDFGTGRVKTIMGDDYKGYISENKERYSAGFKVEIFEGNDLVDVVERK